jgi:hypothetical protein
LTKITPTKPQYYYALTSEDCQLKAATHCRRML